MDYTEIEDIMNDTLNRVKAIVNVLCYTQIAELERMTVPTLMFMAEEQLNRLMVCIEKLKANHGRTV